VDGLFQAASAMDHALVLATSTPHRDVADGLRSLLLQRCEGLILVDPDLSVGAPAGVASGGGAASPDSSAGHDGDGTDKTDKGDDKDDSTDAGDDAEDAAITDSAWKNILDKGERREVAGSYAVQDEGATLNLVGDLDTLARDGAIARALLQDPDLKGDGHDVV